jgi:dihydroorotate dehydrogenase
MRYRWLVRPILFALPAEMAHAIAMRGLRYLSHCPRVLRVIRKHMFPAIPSLTTTAFGLRFPTPVGLAAGLDKDAEAFEAFGALGFGFVEVGTLTAEPQPGNASPRLFRLPVDRALINRMGFNNLGAQAAANRIGKTPHRMTILGVNIGKTRRIPNEAALDDYAYSVEALAAHADYLVVNVSSPNTPGLRDLQAISALHPLLVRVRSALDTAVSARRIPLLLKIAPDLPDDDIDAVADLALALQLDGIIATNTTTARSDLVSSGAEIEACGAGGLSGAPLKARALAVLRRLRARVGTRIALIACGGIENTDDAWERIRAGATLVQIYTALIYEGPLLARRIALGLAQRARAEGFETVPAAIGTGIDAAGAP